VDFHHQVVEREVWAVTDNPLFLPETGEVLHGGNFFGQHVALAADALNNALITLAVHSERRIARITDPSMNQGLPPFLRGNNNGLHSGFMGAQVTATALVAEMRTQASPASIQSIATNANNQDVVTMGTLAARRCATTLERLTELLAIETLILTQGYELRGGKTAGFSQSATRLHQAVRKIADSLGDDRPLAGDIQKLSQQLADPAFIAGLQINPDL
jgi:tyrosine ammonia-lyase